MARFLVFFFVFTSVLFALHAYVAWRLLAPLSPSAKAIGWVVVVLLCLLHPAAFAIRRVVQAPVADVVAWASYITMGVFSLVLVLTVLRDLGWLGARAIGALPPDAARRMALLQMTNAGIVGGATAMFGVGFVQARRRATVVDVRVPIANLPEALVGFTIAQISDIHIGPTIKHGFIQRMVDDVNALGADIVAVTGDLVDGDVEELRAHAAPLAQLRANSGVYFVTGNHEYYSGAPAWIAEVQRLGMRVLLNAHEVIDRGDAKLVVAGVTDISAGGVIPAHASDPHVAVAGAPDGAVRVLLAHQPRSAFEAAKAGFHLQLSGHTHGGQFFPWNLVVYAAQPFVKGLHRLQDMWVYTNRGTGYWGPPLRLGVPAEITRLVLERA